MLKIKNVYFDIFDHSKNRIRMRFVGGGEGSRTPVRKPVHRTFYKLSKRDLVPCAPSLLQNCTQVASYLPAQPQSFDCVIPRLKWLRKTATGGSYAERAVKLLKQRLIGGTKSPVFCLLLYLVRLF
jgi:hypothetical protein